MAHEFARTSHGVVLQDGHDVWIDYVPEPAAMVSHKTLSGGRPYSLGPHTRTVTFREKAIRRDGGVDQVSIIVTSSLPGLAELVRHLDRAASALRERLDKGKGPRRRNP